MLSTRSADTSIAGPSQWKPGHMPRLSYRNASPDDEPDPPLTLTSSHDDISNSSATTLSNTTVLVPASRVTKSRPTSQNVSTASRSASTAAGTRFSMAGASTVANPPNKKRASLFGGLFVKEPSGVALEQLAQKLIAEHGELSARAIPGVSCATMPKTVPKVNSKWDGRPQLTRLKSSRGPEVIGTKSTSSGSSARSRSADPSDRGYTSSRDNQAELWQSSSTSSTNPDSAASQWSQPPTPTTDIDVHFPGQQDILSANALGKLPMSRSARPQSLRSPSGSSLPVITSFFPEQGPGSPAFPPKVIRDENPYTTLPIRAKPMELTRSRPQTPNTAEPFPDGSLDNISSQSATSSEASPATPLSLYTPIRPVGNALSTADQRNIPSSVQSKLEEVTLLSSGKDVLGPPAGAKRKLRHSTHAFLAGEARPLEIPDDHAQSGHRPTGPAGSTSPVLSNLARDQKNLERRPESSKVRLGLRASMIVDTDAAPVLSSLSRVQQDLERRPDSSRARLGLRASMLVDADALPWQSQGDHVDGGKIVHNGTTSGPKMPSSPKSKSKGFGVFGRDKAQR